MMRILLLPLLIFTLSMACMAQTFQYSRGWTNGKRTQSQMKEPHLQRDTDNLIESVDSQSFDRKLERCLQFLQRYSSNSVLRHTAPFSSAMPLKTPHHNGNTDDGINLFPNHHQSSDLFDEQAGGTAIEPNDYGKH